MTADGSTTEAGPGGSPSGNPLCFEFQKSDDIPFVGHRVVAATGTDTFRAWGCTTGDVVVFQVACRSETPIVSVAVSAPEWTFDQVEQIAGSSSVWAAGFIAVVPDVKRLTDFRVDWTPATCTEVWEIGDELNRMDAVDDRAQISGVGNCAAVLTTGHDGDLVWGACSSSSKVIAPGPGDLLGDSDGSWHWTEYRPTTDPAGTAESLTFENEPGQGFVMTAIAAKRR